MVRKSKWFTIKGNGLNEDVRQMFGGRFGHGSAKKGIDMEDDNFLEYVKRGFDAYNVPPNLRQKLESLLSNNSGINPTPKVPDKRQLNINANEFQQIFRNYYRKVFGKKYGAVLTLKDWDVVKAIVYKLDKRNIEHESYLQYVFEKTSGPLTIGQACGNAYFDAFTGKEVSAKEPEPAVEPEEEYNNIDDDEAERMTAMYNKMGALVKLIKAQYGDDHEDIKNILNIVNKWDNKEITTDDAERLVEQYEDKHKETAA